MKKCRIFVPWACRSDEAITRPIAKRLFNNYEFFETTDFPLKAGDFFESYEMMKDRIFGLLHNPKPDIVYIAGDRIEMVAAACCCFHNNIPFAHYGSGIVNEFITTFDDINRHCIGLWATIALCEDRKSYMTLHRLWSTIGRHSLRDKMNIHIVGNVYLDDLEIDESLVPNEEYDLVLINPTTTITEIQHIETERYTIVIGSNPDPKDIQKDPSWTIWKPMYENLPRPQFLGLLKNCTRFITNSSCAYYEAPYLGLTGEQIVMIGERNRLRSTPKDLQNGASDKIINILKEWWISEQNG